MSICSNIFWNYISIYLIYMLFYICHNKYYKTIKTGFLLDFFIKYYIVEYWENWLINFNFFFNDKYSIEYLSIILHHNLLKYFKFLVIFERLNTLYIINVVVLTLILLFLLITIWLVTNVGPFPWNKSYNLRFYSIYLSYFLNIFFLYIYTSF